VILDLVIRAPRVITEAGEVARAVGVRDGQIVAIEAIDAELEAERLLTLHEDEVLLPGLVDPHVHINDPGRAEWEGFATATRAAAAGGVTTVIDMPLNSIPPTCDVQALELKRKTAEGQSYIDVGFWGGAIPSNLGQLRSLHDAGVFGFKCFLLPSGVDEFPHLEPDELERALREVASFGGLMVVHAEDSDSIDHAPSAAGKSYADFLASRPRGAENLAVAQLIELARWTGCRVHIVHLSSSDALAMIRSARRDGVRLTVETCPHYLSFASEEIPDGATQYKCCPPIREADNRESLWRGLADGLIDFIASDHSPCTAELKRFDLGDFGVAWGGIASLQLGLSAVWTQARRRQHSLSDVVAWMATKPAGVAGLRRKGKIARGFDADFCVLAPDETFVVDVARLHHRNAITPYDGRPLAGVVRSTWLRGRQISDHNEVFDVPQGTLLTRGGA
jgi:allantoinase